MNDTEHAQAVRTAAQALTNAVFEAQKAGLEVNFDVNKAANTVAVTVSRPVLLSDRGLASAGA